MPKLRLKDLRLNQVPFYYQTYDGTVDEVDEDGNLTGESIPKYSNPVRVLVRVRTQEMPRTPHLVKILSTTRQYQPYRNYRLMNTQNSS